MNDTTQETAAIDDPRAPADAAPAQAQAQANDPWAADTALQPADADPWGAGGTAGADAEQEASPGHVVERHDVLRERHGVPVVG